MGNASAPFSVGAAEGFLAGGEAIVVHVAPVTADDMGSNIMVAQFVEGLQGKVQEEWRAYFYQFFLLER